jgi:hypothetical protein
MLSTLHIAQNFVPYLLKFLIPHFLKEKLFILADNPNILCNSCCNNYTMCSIYSVAEPEPQGDAPYFVGAGAV